MTLFDRRVSMRLSPTLKSCHQPVSKTTWTTFKSCSCCSFVKDEHATNFLHEMCGHFGDIQKSFPKAKYDGTMKFVCKVDNDEYVMAQMEVMSENCWDMRALSYFASFYATSFAPRTTSHRHPRSFSEIHRWNGSRPMFYHELPRQHPSRLRKTGLDHVF